MSIRSESLAAHGASEDPVRGKLSFHRNKTEVGFASGTFAFCRKRGAGVAAEIREQKNFARGNGRKVRGISNPPERDLPVTML